MKSHTRKSFPTAGLLLLICLPLLVMSCYTGGVGESPYELDPEGIKIHYVADEQLNLYNEQPHALILVVYQLTLPDLFYRYKQEMNGLEELLSADVEDASITGKDRIHIQPGEVKTVDLTRYTGTQYIAIIAGYDKLEGNQVSEVFKIPTKKKFKLPFKLVKIVDHLTIQFRFGPEQIDEIIANEKVRLGNGKD